LLAVGACIKNGDAHYSVNKEGGKRELQKNRQGLVAMLLGGRMRVDDKTQALDTV